MSKLEFLFENTSLHGFKHLANQEAVGWKKSFSRIFWVTFMAFSFFYMIRILKNIIVGSNFTTSINEAK